MRIEDVAEVESRNLERLHRHFEETLMPDDEYIQMTEVLILAGASIVRESGYLQSEIQRFEADLRQQAKDCWLATCAKNFAAEEDEATAMAESGREYDAVLKALQKPKRKRSRA
jgi:hypothetical protein